MNMKKLFCIVAFLLTAIFQMSAQNVIRVEAPDVVAVNEQFNVTFIIEGEKSPSDFQWSSGDDFQLVWGPQKGSSSSIQIINGKRSSSHQTTFTYIPTSSGHGPAFRGQDFIHTGFHTGRERRCLVFSVFRKERRQVLWRRADILNRFR